MKGRYIYHRRSVWTGRRRYKNWTLSPANSLLSRSKLCLSLWNLCSNKAGVETPWMWDDMKIRTSFLDASQFFLFTTFSADCTGLFQKERESFLVVKQIRIFSQSSLFCMIGSTIWAWLIVFFHGFFCETYLRVFYQQSGYLPRVLSLLRQWPMCVGVFRLWWHWGLLWWLRWNVLQWVTNEGLNTCRCK